MLPTPSTAALLLLAATVSCAPAVAPTTPGPADLGTTEPAPDLAPIPVRAGPLELRVSYPRDSGYVTTRGRNFIFGSTGHGDARLWIEGQSVEVQPNGGFLAYLPVPSDGVYRLRATLDGDTARLEVPISLPAPPPLPADTPQILSGSISPTGAWVVLPGERIDVSFTGTANGDAWLALPGGVRVPLVESGGGAAAGATDFEVSPGEADAPSGSGAFATYRGFFSARTVTSGDTTVAWPGLTGDPRPPLPLDTLFEARERAAGVPAGASPDRVPAADRVRRAVERGGGAGGATGAALVLVVGGDTLVRALPLNLLLADPDRPRVGTGWDPRAPENNGDAHVIARPGPGGGPYHYTWRNGVELELTGERNGIYRVRLTDDLSAWTPAGDIRVSPPGSPPPVSRVATVRMDPQSAWIDVHVALDRRLPYAVEEGERSLSLLVYGATSRANFLQHGRTDPFIERGEWSQPSDRVFRLDLHLAGMPWGYEVFWGDGDDLVLRVRRPPTIDPERPLAGLRVGVDAGHGGGDRATMGPTGLTEADANLGIALALREELERRGARVMMTRTTDSTLTLVQRTERAREADVDLWISVHNNAFPDGVNPWTNNGTSVYYNHPRAAGLAWSVQAALLSELGLRDLGVGRADLHQARFTWAPSILTETMFMMIPEQEAFLRTTTGQRRVAEAHARGLALWLRSVARSADPGS